MVHGMWSYLGNFGVLLHHITLYRFYVSVAIALINFCHAHYFILFFCHSVVSNESGGSKLFNYIVLGVNQAKDILYHPTFKGAFMKNLKVTFQGVQMVYQQYLKKDIGLNEQIFSNKKKLIHLFKRHNFMYVFYVL